MFNSKSMRKNGSGSISLGQYRTTDMFLFAGILALAEILTHFAAAWFPEAAIYSFSLMLPIVTVVIMRWGWYGIIFAAADGALYCLLNGYGAAAYLPYVVGNAFVAAELLFILILKKKRITDNWYFSALLLVVGWIAVNLARTLLAVAVGDGFSAAASVAFGLGDNGLLALAMGILVVCVLRRFDGMFEDQKGYLLRQEKEKRRMQAGDTFGEQPYYEISEEDMSILKKIDEDL